MPFVDTRLLQSEGIPAPLIDAYLRAVEDAWAEVVADVRGLGSRPLMSLQLQNPARDRETVTVSVGIGARFGGTSAKSPSELRVALAQHFRNRFVPRASAR